jgi:hypothetical protein
MIGNVGCGTMKWLKFFSGHGAALMMLYRDNTSTILKHPAV